ncbi:MAG TPA: S-layer homology domain-containing protein, partial [Chloroflexia bacterium]|nr:S-layer homology domain-containing protein [Chloroflexia bacterium]
MTRLFPPWTLLTSAVLLTCALLLLGWPAPAASRTGAGRPADPPILDAWIVNTTGVTNPHWPSAPVYVQSVQSITIGGVPYVQVQTHSIPDYHTTMTTEQIQQLNSRPRAATDFRLGHTTATVGQVVRFGDDIGYVYTSCALGYWPPGPGCPTAQNTVLHFPMQPLPATQVVSTALGTTGLWVDGTAVFNWSDGQSYQNGQVWWNTAMSFEVYDMDICPGHAAMGNYHHHSYAECLAQLVNDTGNGPSPVYGFAADGYPIYGPWETAGQLAQSGWRTRDYDTPSSPTGCGVAYVRNCLLRNPLDPSQGTVPSGQTGPRTDSTVTTQSGNVISATSGIFQQDYWYDSSCTTCLDVHNGHDTGDGRGYHYHVTVVQDQATGRLVPVYPYTFGPTYAGQLQPNATYTPTSTAVPGSPTTITTTTPGPPPPTATATARAATSTPPAATNTPGASPTPCAISFSDVHPSDYFAAPVRDLACRGAISGYADGTFRPYTNTTRAQMVKIVVLGFGIPIRTPAGSAYTFADVPPSNAFFAVIETAAAASLVSGYACGQAPAGLCDPQNRPWFLPNNFVTRGQLTKIDVVGAGWPLLNPASRTFEDVRPGSAFYQFVETAAARSVVSGYTCGVAPAGPCGNPSRP